MISAIYARKSTSQSDVADVEKSVTRQISLAKAFAAEQGWQVIEEYVDDGISGQESVKLVNRARMLADATQGKFSVIIVRDYDRISRDDREGPAFVYMLADAGVPVWEYTTRAPIKVDRAMDRTMLNMKAGFAAHEAEAASSRTREKKFDRAQQGTIADGRVLGYRTVGDAKARRREVDPDQAALVVRIFEMAAQGKGLLKIANTLNTEGVVNPTGQIRRDKDGKVTKASTTTWATSGVREILRRETYRGVVVYGKTRNVRKGGKRSKAAGNPVTIERPELRIVPDELWNAVRARQEQTRAAYVRRNDGRLNGRPESGLESKYLLAGFLKCGLCGGAMFAQKRTGKRGRPTMAYACGTHRVRGNVACTENRSVGMRDLHEIVVSALHEVLTPERLDEALREFADQYAAQADAHRGQRIALNAEIASVDVELRNLTNAIAGGRAPDAVLAAIKEREARRRDLNARIEHLDGLERAAGRVSREDFARGLRTVCRDWRTLLDGGAAQGRRALRDLKIGRVVVARNAETGAWSFKVEGDVGAVLAKGEFGSVPEPGAGWREVRGSGKCMPEQADPQVQQRWCPRGDSNTRLAV